MPRVLSVHRRKRQIVIALPYFVSVSASLVIAFTGRGCVAAFIEPYGLLNQMQPLGQRKKFKEASETLSNVVLQLL